MSFLKNRKKLIFALFFVFSIVFWLFRKPNEQQVVTSSSDIPHPSTSLNGNFHGSSLNSNSRVLTAPIIAPEKKIKSDLITKSFEYEDELKRIDQLRLELPNSKPELIRIITEKNPFIKEQIPVRLHSIEEIKQRQMEAIKIKALKALIEREDSKVSLVGDLNQILKSSTDTHIQQLAIGARDSAQTKKKSTKTKL